MTPITRVRRGKVVVIPPEWVGRVTSRQTINKRPSKVIHKLRKLVKGSADWKRGPRRAEQRRVREEGA